MKHKLICLLAATGMVSALVGCFKADEKIYGFIGKDSNNQYMKKVYDGLSTACEELGSTAVFKAPDPKGDVVEQQKQQVRELINEGADGIAISANDETALHDVLQEAMAAGIEIVSVDSAVCDDCRSLHIGQTDPTTVSRTLMDAVYDLCGGSGKYAILSTTPDAPNQNSWIEQMDILKESDKKYSNIDCVAIEYGNDDMEDSKAAVLKLLENPGIEVILSPTTVGMSAAGEIMAQSGTDVKLTGLGLPSEMSEYIESGICPKMYMWNPEELGYLAGYAFAGIDKDKVTGAVGERFDAGKLGSKTVTESLAGGSEVCLGDLSEFDTENIGKWKNVY